MKAITKTVVIFIALLFSTLTLMGQKSLLFQDIQPLMADLKSGGFDIELSVDYSLSSYQFYMEDRLQVEAWMLNSEHWSLSEPETEIRLENWMVEPDIISDINLSELIKVGAEEPLKLEKWMYCCTDWKIVSM